MSKKLYEMASAFIHAELDAESFVDQYQRLWKEERDNDLLLADENDLSLCLSTLFCLTDLYDPEDDRLPYEIDAAELIKRIEACINELNLKTEPLVP